MMSNTKKQAGYIALQKFNHVITVLLTAILLGLSFPEVRVLADVPYSDLDLTFYTDSALDININSSADSIIFRVPLFVKINVSNVNRYKYISGYLNSTSGSIVTKMPCTVDSFAANYLYYEPINDSIYINRPDLSTVVVYFNSFFIDANASSANYVIQIGYIYYSAECTDGIANVRFNTNSYTPTFGYSPAFTISDAPTGIYTAIMEAINNASDIDSIISVLNTISSDTRLLASILQAISDNGSLLANIYARLGQMHSTETSLYNEVYSYIHGSNSGANAASEAAADLGSQANVQASMEAVLASLSPGDFSDIDNADAFGVLRDTTVSLSFWGQLVSGFADYSGVIWGFFILALMLGLIAFILRLR